MSEASDHERLLARFGRSFAAGEILFRNGDEADCAYLLQEGRIRLFRIVGGTERSLRIAKPGDLFGETALLDGGRRNATAVALDDGNALALTASTLQTVISTNAVVGVRVLQQVVRRLRHVEDQLEVLLIPSAQAKVVAALVKLAELAGATPGNPIEVPMAPSELSTLAGLDVDTVRHVARKLRDNGYIAIDRQQLRILELEGLRELGKLLGINSYITGAPQAPPDAPARS